MENPILFYSHQFKLFYHEMFRSYQKEHQMTQLEIDILLFFINNPYFDTAKNLCEIRGIAKSNASNAIRTLEKKGLLSSRTDEHNRRIRRISLTALGTRHAKELQLIQRDCFEKILYDFSREEICQMQDFLRKSSKNMSVFLKKLQEESKK